MRNKHSSSFILHILSACLKFRVCEKNCFLLNNDQQCPFDEQLIIIDGVRRMTSVVSKFHRAMLLAPCPLHSSTCSYAKRSPGISKAEGFTFPRDKMNCDM